MVFYHTGGVVTTASLWRRFLFSYIGDEDGPALLISTAIRTALKVAPRGPNPGKKKARLEEQKDKFFCWDQV